MSQRSHNKSLIPWTAFILFSTASLLLWRHQNNHDRELVLRHVERSVEQVRIRLEGLMNARLASLELMAERWEERQPPDFSQERFQGFASALSRNYPGYAGCYYIDSTGAVRWVSPVHADVAAISSAVAPYLRPDRPADADYPQEETAPVITPCMLTDRGGATFHALRALTYKNHLQGYLGGFFTVEQIMNLSLTQEMLNDFLIRVSEENRTIYLHGIPGRMEAAPPVEGPVKAVRELRFGGKRWKIALMPNEISYPLDLGKNAAMLAFGLTLSAALSLVLRLLIKRMEMYKASRDQAVMEVSERKQAQAALRDNEKKLQALLAELTTKNAELESFVYTVSHDLKTPIVTIEGFIGALREDFGDRIPAAGEQYLGHMSAAARKMELLINELLNYSRIGRQDGRKTEFSMNEPVREIIAALRPQIEARGIAVSVQTDLPDVYADRKRIDQVVDNLLSNAIKYIGRDNADPRIDIGCRQQNGENVFWIRDNGIGIDQKYFDKIFQIFQRLPAAKLAGEGTGIGLAIVKRIIENHGGRIWLDSELDQGTTFYFTIKDKEAR